MDNAYDNPEGNDSPDPSPVKLPAGMDEGKVIGPTGAASDATVGTMAVSPRFRTNDEGVEIPEDLIESFTASGQRIRNRIWALVQDGIVVVKRMTRHAQFHPFTDEEMAPKSARAIDVSNTDCQVGYLADEKGNVTPPGTRTTALPPGQPAYHDLHLVQPLTSLESARKFSLIGMAGGPDAEDAAEAQANAPPRTESGRPVVETNPAPPPPPQPAEGEVSASPPPPPPPPSMPVRQE